MKAFNTLLAALCGVLLLAACGSGSTEQNTAADSAATQTAAQTAPAQAAAPMSFTSPEMKPAYEAVKAWLEQNAPNNSVIFTANRPDIFDDTDLVRDVPKLLLYATRKPNHYPAVSDLIKSRLDLLAKPVTLESIKQIRAEIPKGQPVYMIWVGNVNAPSDPSITYLFNHQNQVLVALVL